MGTAVLAFALTVNGAAQIRGMGVTQTDRAAANTAAGSAAAAGSLAFRNGGTFWDPNRPVSHPGFVQGFPRHHHGGFAFAGPVYYGGYLPYGYAYDPGYYTGYIPGSFDSATSAGYPYPPGYAPPLNYYPPAPNSFSSSSSASSPAAASSGQNNAPEPAPRADSTAPSSHGVAKANNSEESTDPTVLVFRDGHKQRVDNYAIMGPTLFVLSGSHARIAIAELDIPATVQLNEERGVDFHVPQR
jgi:hypothetical protein